MDKGIKLKTKLQPKTIALLAGLGAVLLTLVILLVVSLVQRPKFDLLGEKEITLEVFDAYQEAGFSAKLRKKDLSSQVTTDNPVDTKVLGDYTITYTLKHRNKTYTAERLVHIVDRTAPELVLTGEAEMQVSHRKLFSEPGFTVNDNYEGDLSGKVTVKETSDGEYCVFEYTVSDASGNTSTATRRVLIKDSTPPVITLTGGKNYSVIVGSTYAEPGFSATDDVDGTLSSSVQVSGSVDAATLGTYSITYTVTDSSGNKASVERKVHVINQPVTPQHPAGQSIIYLTFDDGPSSTTTVRILDTLKANGVKATFFICNYDASAIPILQRMINEGHTIGIHGYSHVYKTIYATEDAFMYNINRLREKLRNDTGYDATIIRFPGGSSNTVSRVSMSSLVRTVSAAGYLYADWNVDSNDALGNGVAVNKIINSTVNGLRHNRGNTVLMHDTAAKKTTADALQTIIDYGKNNGYTFAALTQDVPMVHHGTNS